MTNYACYKKVDYLIHLSLTAACLLLACPGQLKISLGQLSFGSKLPDRATEISVKVVG